LEPSKEAAKGIRFAIKSVYKKAYPTYKKMMEEDGLKEKIFEEFSRCCTWDPRHDEEVEQNFHLLAKIRLSGMLYDARKRGERPLWIGERLIWPELLEYWKKDEAFNKRSEANKKNIRSKKGGNLHTQGCVSLDTHVRHLVKIYLIYLFNLVSCNLQLIN
jgi:hypothetical protein